MSNWIEKGQEFIHAHPELFDTKAEQWKQFIADIKESKQGSFIRLPDGISMEDFVKHVNTHGAYFPDPDAPWFNGYKDKHVYEYMPDMHCGEV